MGQTTLQLRCFHDALAQGDGLFYVVLEVAGEVVDPLEIQLLGVFVLGESNGEIGLVVPHMFVNEWME